MDLRMQNNFIFLIEFIDVELPRGIPGGKPIPIPSGSQSEVFCPSEINL